MSPLTGPPRLGVATLVIGHEEDLRVRYRIEEAERAFSALVSGAFRSTNVDQDAKANVPRLMGRKGGRVLTLANSRIQYVMSFHEDRIDSARGIDIVEKHVRQVFEASLNFQPESKIRMLGLIVELGYAADSPPGDVHSWIADRLYSGPRLGPIVTCDLKLGFERPGGLYSNVQFGTYELRKGEGRGLLKAVDMNTLPLEERGLGVTIDVNNRPALTAGEYNARASVEALLTETKELVVSGHKQFLGG